jgi:sugar-specific transcriptional regulator TrmB
MAEHREMIDELQALGLTEYEARCFVALTTVESATAAEVSQLCDIPRSRVYDTAESLAEQGFIQISEGSPTEYRALPVEQVSEKLHQEYRSRIDTVTDQLEELQVSRSLTQDGIWHLKNREQVLTRAQTLIETANEEVMLVEINDELLLDECVNLLEEAEERGVDVAVITELDVLREQLDGRLSTTIPSSSLTWLNDSSEEGMVGRVMMTDRQTVLVATVSSSPSTGDSSVMGIWAQGQQNPIVIVFRQLFQHHVRPVEEASRSDN